MKTTPDATLFSLHGPEDLALERLREAWRKATEPQRLTFLEELRQSFFRARRSQPQTAIRHGNPRRARRRP